MKKRFLEPIWKIEEIETKLTELEKEGWRLNKTYGLRCFEFVEAKPKASQYFFTYNLTREMGMIETEQMLKEKHNAKKIDGRFVEGLVTTSVYRITTPFDVSELILNRNKYLIHVVLQKILLNLFLLLIIIGGTVLKCTFSGTSSVSVFDFIFFGVVFAVCICCFIYNLSGLIYLKKKNIDLAKKDD